MKRLDDPALVIVSCDRYSPCWRPFHMLLKHYWPDCPYDAYLCTESKEDSDCSFHYIHPVYPKAEWGGRLLEYLEQIPNNYCFLILEDQWPGSKVEQSFVTSCSTMIQKDNRIGCIYLGSESPTWNAPVFSDYPSYRLIPFGRPYRVSVSAALWNKAFLKSLLSAEDTAWAFEREGSFRAAGEKKIVLHYYAEKVWNVFSPAGAISKGRWVPEAAPFLEAHGIPFEPGDIPSMTGWDVTKQKFLSFIWNLNPGLIVRIQNYLASIRR